jgi:hypothetical protein
MVKIVENAERLVVEDGRRLSHRTAEHAHREGDVGASVHGAIEQGTAKALVVPEKARVYVGGILLYGRKHHLGQLRIRRHAPARLRLERGALAEGGDGYALGSVRTHHLLDVVDLAEDDVLVLLWLISTLSRSATSPSSSTSQRAARSRVKSAYSECSSVCDARMKRSST